MWHDQSWANSSQTLLHTWVPSGMLLKFKFWFSLSLMRVRGGWDSAYLTSSLVRVMLLFHTLSSKSLRKQPVSYLGQGLCFPSLFPHNTSQHFGLFITDTPPGWMLLMLLLTLSLPSHQPPCSPPRLPSLRSKRQGSPTSCCMDTYILACFLIRKEEKQSAAKSNLLLLEVYTDSLELWGNHQKLIVLEGVAHLLPFPNLISRLCNEARIRATLKMGRKKKNLSTIKFWNLQGAFLPVSAKNYLFY